MFGLFKKKEKEAAIPLAADAVGEEVKAFAAHFLPDEISVLAVTAPSGFGTTRGEGDQLPTMAVALSAWLEEDSPEICRDPTLLVAKADDALMNHFRQRLPRDFIIKFNARPSQDGKRLLLTNLPEPGFDPDLKAILDAQKAPVTLQADDLGTFTLNRSSGIFQLEYDWEQESVLLAFDPDEDREGCLATARALIADTAGWDERVRTFAADRLLSLANEQAEDEEAEAISREEFLDYLEIETIELAPDSRFQFWFSDGGLFYGRSVRVSGTLSNGPTDAQVEG